MRQPVPRPASAERTGVIGTVVGWIPDLGSDRLRVGVGGLTGAGKTSFGHELAAALRTLSRPAPVADFVIDNRDFASPRILSSRAT